MASHTSERESLTPLPLPRDITTSYVDSSSSCGLVWHILEAGERGKPLVLFCHGYPEIAYSWRGVLPKVAQAGYYCVAMDQRGSGRTTGWPNKSFDEVDLNDYAFTNLVRDLVCLVYGLGYTEVYSIIGHDFGAVSSSMAALMRPDIFRSTIQLSNPHHAPPVPKLEDKDGPSSKVDIQAELAKLDPPRKHYQFYNSTPNAASDWNNPPQGLEAYLRGYFHLKSADWAKNDPHPLEKWGAKELEVLPEYYIMQKEQTMPETVAQNMTGEDFSKTERWLSKKDIQVYCNEWSRIGFQGALNWYRVGRGPTPQTAKDLLLFSGRRLEVPCIFISGKQDWGNYQQPGAIEGYEDSRVVKEGCFKGTKLIDAAGHWVQQEQPEAVVREILEFFKTLK